MTAGPGSTVLRIADTRVQVESQGSGDPFLLVHSLLTGPEAFAEIAESLARRYRVYRLSLPGFGHSDPLPGDTVSIYDLADHVNAAMEALGLGPDATVLGNGLGGFVAVALAIRHGSGFRRLIVANAGAGFSEERTAAFHVMSRRVAEGGMTAVVDIAVQRIFPPVYIESNPEVIEERRAVLASIDPGAFAAACRALARTDLRPGLGSIGNDTLVVVGEADATTPPEMGRELAVGIPRARLAALSGCGHCPQIQAPGELLAAIERFIDDA